MKIFQSTMKFLAVLGLTAESRPFNMRNLLSLIVFEVLVLSCLAFLFFEAKTFRDYTESIYFSSTAILMFLISLTFIWKKDNIFKFIDKWQEISEASE